MVEPQIVVLVVAVSSPVGHPPPANPIPQVSTRLRITVRSPAKVSAALPFPQLEQAHSMVKLASGPFARGGSLPPRCWHSALQIRNFFVDARFRICNFARHVHE